MMDKQLLENIQVVEDYILNAYKRNFREPMGTLKNPFFVPGANYTYEMWDWDSWLTDIALFEVAEAKGEDISVYEKGCVLNFLDHADEDGRIPINVIGTRASIFDLVPGKEVNIHKPCLAQHALFICEKYNGDVAWLKDGFATMKKFVDWYEKNCKHQESGLYFWMDDFAIGTDNDPCVFYRPKKSTAAIYLNCLLYSEFLAMAKLCEMLGDNDVNAYMDRANALKDAIQAQCWDERDGFFYNADILLMPIQPDEWLHSGCPRHWQSLPMRIEYWTGFLPLWNGIATKEQAERIIKEHYLNEKTFYAPYGVRSLSKMEKMYLITESGNPSCWLGPIWANANYMVFEGLLKYGYTDLAKELAVKTVTMFAMDINECGDMHEYYDPETGAPVHNKGFQSWNLLAYNLCQWLRENA